MSYQTGEIVELLNLSYAQEMQLYRWRDAGAITPSIQRPAGQGTRARWSREDFDRIRCIFNLCEQFYAASLLMNNRVVADVWNTLSRGEPWQLCFDLSLEPVPA